MTNKLLAVVSVLAMIGLLTGFGGVYSHNLTTTKQPDTVPYVNISKYAGAWYEQAVIPFYFERGCSKTTAHYSLNSDGSIKVNNTCFRNGAFHEAIGRAVSKDPSNAKLQVSFIQTFDIGAPYWVVRLADDYSYSVVSNPTYKNLWILSRQRVMDQALYDQIYNDLKKNNFPVQKLVRTQQ